MVQLDIIPKELLRKLDEKGIDENSIKLSIKTDMNNEGVICDNWLIVTVDDLIIISGSKVLLPKENLKVTDTKRLQTEFSEITYDYYSLEDISDFKVEELISSARVTAKSKEEDKYVLLANLTNTCKTNMQLFIKYISQLKEKKEIIVDDEEKPEELICPKCGGRFPDSNRKICPKCMDKGKIIKRISVFFLKYKLSIITIIIMLIIMSSLGIISPYISAGFFYDEVLDSNGSFFGQILLVLIIIILTRIFSLIVNIVNGIVSSRIAAKIVYDLKKVIFTSIERLSISFFTGRQTGGLMTQVNNDANTIYQFFCDGMPYFLIVSVQIIVVFIIMVVLNPILAILSMITIPAFAFLVTWLFSRMEKLHAKRYSHSRALNATLSDVLSGVRVVKAFSKEKDEIKRFDSQSTSLAESEKKLSLFNNIAFPIASFTLFLGNIIVWGVGGWMTIKGTMTYGTLLTFVAYMNMVYSPMFSFIDMVYWSSNFLNAIQRLLEIMDAVPEVVEKENPTHLDNVQGRVTFKDVEFSYVKNRKAIDGVSFDIEPGKVIGIVGHTGAGKSTLANLLIRLYDVSTGEILIDGINVKDIAFDDLRRNVAIVSQETYLFIGTILENIKYAKPDATNAEVIEAATIAGAHDFIIKLPDAYSTRIGFGYKDLSGGERQRLSIARAVLRNPKILIMDEATAAMDTETERQIQKALERLVKGKTTIMIAHRLSTLRDADKLIVIENGKMPESGTHLELINKKGIYFNLYKMQVDALKNIGIEA